MRGETYASEFERIERCAEDWVESCKAESEGKWKSLDEHNEGVDKPGALQVETVEDLILCRSLGDGSIYICCSKDQIRFRGGRSHD